MFSFDQIGQIAPHISLIGFAIALLFLLFFAGMRVAFLTTNRLNVELMRNQRTPQGLLMGKLIDRKYLFIAPSVFAIILFTVVYALFFNELMNSGIWIPIKFKNPYVTLLSNVILSSILVVFVGYFLAKVIFIRNDKLFFALLGVATSINKLLLPLVNALQSIVNGILQYLFNVKIQKEKHPFQALELEQRSFWSDDEPTEEMDNPEINTFLFERALALPQMKIRQCFVPRTEIVALELNTPVDLAREKMIASKMSKIVVYEKDIDNIVGYVLMIDFFKNPPNLQSIVIPTFVVPETKSIIDLLNKFITDKKSIAWVIDEFGGTAGIISVENIIKELFGNLNDTNEQSNFVETQLADDEYLLSGRIDLSRLNDKFDLDFPEAEAETLSGFIIKEFKRIPKEKDKVVIDNFYFDILSVSDTKIDLVKLKILK